MEKQTGRRSWLAITAITFVALLATGVVAAAAWTVSHTVQGNGKVLRQDRMVAAFTGVDLDLPAQVTVRPGTTPGVSIEADENLLPLVVAVVDKGVLKLRTSRDNLRLSGSAPIRITITGSDLKSLAISGSGSIDAAALAAPELELDIAGSGEITVGQVDAAKLSADIAGSGTIRIAGAAGKLSVAIAGSGDLLAPKLKAAEVAVNIAGSGNAQVWATRNLSTSIAGSGDVSYWGDATAASSIMGSGSVRRLGAVPM